jgi:hypothetical protein
VALSIPVVAFPISLGATVAPEPGQPVLVVAPPWSGGAAEIVERASGREIYPTRAPLAVMAVFDDPSQLETAGAWLVLDGRRVAAICGIELGG